MVASRRFIAIPTGVSRIEQVIDLGSPLFLGRGAGGEGFGRIRQRMLRSVVLPTINASSDRFGGQRLDRRGTARIE